eukprot:10515527-Ditylum_brightwellii.AAC.1
MSDAVSKDLEDGDGVWEGAQVRIGTTGASWWHWCMCGHRPHHRVPLVVHSGSKVVLHGACGVQELPRFFLQKMHGKQGDKVRWGKVEVAGGAIGQRVLVVRRRMAVVPSVLTAPLVAQMCATKLSIALIKWSRGAARGAHSASCMACAASSKSAMVIVCLILISP